MNNKQLLFLCAVHYLWSHSNRYTNRAEVYDNDIADGGVLNM